MMDATAAIETTQMLALRHRDELHLEWDAGIDKTSNSDILRRLRLINTLIERVGWSSASVLLH